MIIGFGVVAFTILGFVYYRILKGKKPTNTNNNVPEVMDSSKTDLSKGVIVSLPATNFANNELLIIWGGISYATPSWVYTQIPKEVLYKYVIVIAPYNLPLSALEGVYKPFLEQKKVNVSSTSIIGFSAGALQVQNAYSDKYKLVGLVDPSTRANNLQLPFGSNTKMVYNERNWGGSLQTIKELLPKLAKTISDKGGLSERLDLKHADIPKHFFQKYL
jgi:hypothetical protein